MTNSEAYRESRKLGWDDIASPDWYPEGETGPVWLTGYIAMGIDHSRLCDGQLMIDFGDARVMVVYGQIPYVRLTNAEIRSTNPPQFHTRIDDAMAPEGGYLIVVMPFDETEGNVSEVRCRARVDQIVGLIVAVLGPNMAYRHLFDNVVYTRSNQRSAFGESFRVPFTLPIPNLSQERINLVQAANEAALRLPSRQANRVWLSLRWYLDAQASKGVDLFLKLWFALESLGMASRDNLSPIAESLGRAYSIPASEAKSRFSLGPLFGFRSRIVHQGEIHPIHALLSDFVAGLYVDVLFELLSLPPDHVAAGIQATSEFDLSAFIS